MGPQANHGYHYPVVLHFFRTDLLCHKSLADRRAAIFGCLGRRRRVGLKAALVAEVFPRHARAHASGIFHATSVLGTWIAALTGLWVGMQWRYAYLISLFPALLVLWVLWTVKEPESWQTAEKAD